MGGGEHLLDGGVRAGRDTGAFDCWGSAGNLQADCLLSHELKGSPNNRIQPKFTSSGYSLAERLLEQLASKTPARRKFRSEGERLT
ncbi:hypothetical protein EVAR_30400_1 [Eumeta japonica]|uniref:Uncharacterized protein n=1 Tax=Eumeta variegata TaxID=151549 RepID=A0A4C1W5C8_EUMVA|nr:hypothetical protein EVAR_30400_1 [Eumeta japonica]